VIKLVEARTKEQLDNVRALYVEAFPKEERKDFELMLEKRDAGSMEIFSIENEEGEFLGLTITVLYKDLVLWDYLACCKEIRGKGVGSEVIRLLKERYQEKRVVLEFESTLVPCDNLIQRKRRKALYERIGLKLLPYQVSLFGIEMEMMSTGAYISFEDYHKIYDKVFGEKISKNIVFLGEDNKRNP